MRSATTRSSRRTLSGARAARSVPGAARMRCSPPMRCRREREVVVVGRRDSAAPPGRRGPVHIKGHGEMAEAAVQAGCDAYFGYPITPQAELLEWMALRMPELGRVFVQAESELGAINMALGAAATGARVLVSSSSPGISLMAEAMSYLAGSEVPIVLINV